MHVYRTVCGTMFLLCYMHTQHDATPSSQPHHNSNTINSINDYDDHTDYYA